MRLCPPGFKYQHQYHLYTFTLAGSDFCLFCLCLPIPNTNGGSVGLVLAVGWISVLQRVPICGLQICPWRQSCSGWRIHAAYVTNLRTLRQVKVSFPELWFVFQDAGMSSGLNRHCSHLQTMNAEIHPVVFIWLYIFKVGWTGYSLLLLSSRLYLHVIRHLDVQTWFAKIHLQLH